MVDSPPCGAMPPRDARDVAGIVAAHDVLADGFRRMRVHAPALAHAFAPGQFFQLLVDDADGGAGWSARPFLRRPFAPSRYWEDGFEFVYAVVGTGTERMATLPPGAPLRVIAPLGHGYTPPDDPSTPALLVGGGCGAPSLRPWAEALTARGVRVAVVHGASRAEALLDFDAWSACAAHARASTDDGSRGFHGDAVRAVRDWLDHGPWSGEHPAVYACGPRGLLAALARWTEERGLDCQVSLEERMACGFGACVGCAVALRDDAAPGGRRYGRVCHDGPVFDARRVLWGD